MPVLSSFFCQARRWTTFLFFPAVRLKTSFTVSQFVVKISHFFRTYPHTFPTPSLRQFTPPPARFCPSAVRSKNARLGTDSKYVVFSVVWCAFVVPTVAAKCFFDPRLICQFRANHEKNIVRRQRAVFTCSVHKAFVLCLLLPYFNTLLNPPPPPHVFIYDGVFACLPACLPACSSCLCCLQRWGSTLPRQWRTWGGVESFTSLTVAAPSSPTWRRSTTSPEGIQ